MSAPRFATLALLSCGLCGCPPPLRPPTKTTPNTAATAKRDLGPLVAVGFGADVVGFDDVTMKPDGAADFVLRVRISGDVKALVLHSSDPAGRPVGAEIWDTLTPPDQFPPEWHLPGNTGGSHALAVLDAAGKLLNPELRLPPTVFADATLTISAGDTARVRFVPGRTYTLIVQRNDGSVDRTTTTLL